MSDALIVLCPVEFTAELGIEQEDVTSILHYLLQSRTRASEAIRYRQDRSCTAFATQKKTGLETRLTPRPGSGLPTLQ